MSDVCYCVRMCSAMLETANITLSGLFILSWSYRCGVIYAMNGYTYLLDIVAVVYPIQRVPVNFNIVWNPFCCCIACTTGVGDEYGVSFIMICEVFLGV